MRAWRLCRKPFARQPLDGRGGLRASGRWHLARRLVTYASESLALAGLEVLVHVDLDLVPDDLVAIEISIPDSVRTQQIRVADLPRGWRRYPAPASLQRLGNSWLDGGRTAVLRVPSAIIPSEDNLLINPLHPDARRIRVLRRMAFAFDERLADAKRRQASRP